MEGRGAGARGGPPGTLDPNKQLEVAIDQPKKFAQVTRDGAVIAFAYDKDLVRRTTFERRV